MWPALTLVPTDCLSKVSEFHLSFSSQLLCCSTLEAISEWDQATGFKGFSQSINLDLVSVILLVSPGLGVGYFLKDLEEGLVGWLIWLH